MTASHHNRVFVGNPAGLVSTVAHCKSSSTYNKEGQNLTTSQNLAQSRQFALLQRRQAARWSWEEMLESKPREKVLPC